jgi:WD40 repeat protein
VRSIAYSPDGNMVATGAEDGLIKLWSVSNGKEIKTFDVSQACINVVQFSPDGNLLASGSTDGCVRLWVVNNGEMTHCFDEHLDLDQACEVEDLAFSPDGKMLASACTGQTVSLWDVATGKEKLNLKGHRDIVNSVAFLPDGRTIVSASEDATIRLWDISAIEESHEPKAHSDAVSIVAFSPDGKLVASAARMDGNGVRLWDTATGTQVLEIPIFEPIGNIIAFSPCGETMTLLWDKAVKGKWALTTNNDTGQLIATSILEKPHVSNQHALVRNNSNPGNAETSACPYREEVYRSPPPRVTMETPWIKRNDENFILLPYEYRGVCFTISGSSIAIGQASGTVTILSLM